MSVALNFELFPKQKAALYAPAQETLYGGAAGGGKSVLSRIAAITWALAVPGFTCALFRRTYGDLEANHMQGHLNFRDMLAPLVAEKRCHITQKNIRFENGSLITLNHLGNINDLDRYQGRAFQAALIDEATQFHENEYEYIRTRVRMGGIRVPAGLNWLFPRILLTANPGGVGHHWVKKGFVTPGAFVVTKMAKEAGGMTRTFVPARLEDNPRMAEGDPDYADRLSGLGDPLYVRALRDGDWNVAKGSMFGEQWRTALHTCQPFAIPAEWDMWRGGDDGYGMPAAVLWFARDPQTKIVYVIDELYQKGMLPEFMAHRCKERDRRIIRVDSEGNEFESDEVLPGILDSACFDLTGTTNEVPRGHDMNKHGARWKPCKKWAGSRVHGVQLIHRQMAPQPNLGGRPLLRIFTNCRNLIDHLPVIPRDPNNPEDVDGDYQHDHLIDALRYGLQWTDSKVRLMKVRGN